MKRSVRRTPDGQWRSYAGFGECLRLRKCQCATFDTWALAIAHACRDDAKLNEELSA